MTARNTPSGETMRHGRYRTARYSFGCGPSTEREKTRRIFLMNRIERIPHRRIAEQLGITDEAVYYHIRRALERLAALRDECIG